MNIHTKLAVLMLATFPLVGFSLGGDATAAETQPVIDHPTRAHGAEEGKLQWYRGRNGRPHFPAAVEKLVVRGMALMQKKQWQDAITKFDHALKLMPSSAAIHEYRGVCRQQLHEFRLAIADYTRALELDPDMAAVAYENRAYCHKELGELELALADFDKALAAAPEREDPLLLVRGRVLVDLGKTKRAEQDFHKALAYPAIRAQAYSELAYLAMNRFDFQSCIDLSSEAVRADSNFADGWVNRGSCEISMGQYREAVADLSVAIRLAPGFTEAYLNRSVAYAALDDCQRALQDAATAARLEPEKEDIARRLVSRCIGPDGEQPEHKRKPKFI